MISIEARAKLSKPTTCRRCHRALTQAVSIVRGYGPVCWLVERKQLSLFDDAPVTPEGETP